MSLRKFSKADFEMMEQLGSGAYGTVFKAIEKSTAEIVAIKIIKLDSEWMPLLAEVNMVVDLKHDSIVKYKGWFFQEDKLWLVMEYCDGGSLSDVMETLGHGLTETEVASVCAGVLKSLIYVHSLNRIHRDIKAGNLLITSKGKVKLCDFGVSSQLDNSLAETGTRIGSPYWMAPEVIKATGHNTKADIWSFGITALELYCGYPPRYNQLPMTAMLAIPTAPPPEAPEGASKEFKKFIARALQKDPKKRPTAQELYKDKFIKQVKHNKRSIIEDLVAKYNVALEHKKANPNNEEEEDEEAVAYVSSPTMVKSTIKVSPIRSIKSSASIDKAEESDKSKKKHKHHHTDEDEGKDKKHKHHHHRKSKDNKDKDKKEIDLRRRRSASDKKQKKDVISDDDILTTRYKKRRHDSYSDDSPPASSSSNESTFKNLTTEQTSTILFGGTFRCVANDTFVKVNPDNQINGTFVKIPETNDGTFVKIPNQADDTFVKIQSNDGTFVKIPSTNDGTFVKTPNLDGSPKANGTFVMVANGTFVPVNDGTFVSKNQCNSPPGPPEWEPVYLDTPFNNNQIVKAQKRQFSNFSIRDLKYMLRSVKKLAKKSLKEKKISELEIRANYEEVRAGIVDELRRQDPSISEDYGKI